MSTDDDGLIAAFLLDGTGGGDEIDWHGVGKSAPESGLLWVHLDRAHETAQDWLLNESGVDPVIAEALLAEETRPRSFSTPQGLFVILRGVNLNPGAEPEDMVSLRIWLEERRVISVRIRRVMGITDIRNRINEGRGPTGAANFLSHITHRLIERMDPAIHDMVERVDALEESLETAEYKSTRKQLVEIRHRAVVLRRYLAPQREALGRIQMEQIPWFTQESKLELREAVDRTTRYVEDLDEIRERSAILQDELANALSMDMNKRVYVLTILAALIMPMSLVSGLLGMNVGGVPLMENKLGFWLVIGGLSAVSVLAALIFRKLKWL